MREVIRKQHKSWKPKEEEALAAGVRKYGSGNWKIMLKYSKFARYLAQRSTSGLWKTMKVGASDEKLKPLSPTVKKIAAANMEVEGNNDRQSCAKAERISEKEEMDVQSCADPQAVREAKRIRKMKEYEDGKSMLLLANEILARCTTQDTNQVSANIATASSQVAKESKGASEMAKEGVKESEMAQKEEISMMDAQSSTNQSEAVKETERILRMKEFEEAKSMLVFANEILARSTRQDTNEDSASIATASSQVVKKSKGALEMEEDIDRFPAASPTQAEKEIEVTSRMEEDTDQVPVPVPAPSQAIEETNRIFATVEETRAMLQLMSQICETFLN